MCKHALLEIVYDPASERSAAVIALQTATACVVQFYMCARQSEVHALTSDMVQRDADTFTILKPWGKTTTRTGRAPGTPHTQHMSLYQCCCCCRCYDHDYLILLLAITLVLAFYGLPVIGYSCRCDQINSHMRQVERPIRAGTIVMCRLSFGSVLVCATKNLGGNCICLSHTDSRSQRVFEVSRRSKLQSTSQRPLQSPCHGCRSRTC